VQELPLADLEDLTSAGNSDVDDNDSDEDASASSVESEEMAGSSSEEEPVKKTMGILRNRRRGGSALSEADTASIDSETDDGKDSSGESSTKSESKNAEDFPTLDPSTRTYQLAKLKVKELRAIAVAAAVDPDDLEEARDSDDAKAEIIKLIVAQELAKVAKQVKVAGQETGKLKSETGSPSKPLLSAMRNVGASSPPSMPVVEEATIVEDLAEKLQVRCAYL
jgi:hypothetical protein